MITTTHPSAATGEAQASEDGQWDDTFDTRTLARLLVPYDVRPRLMRFGDAVVRGYERADLADAFGRYLAPTVDDVRDAL
jgi:hypothetical protein